MAESNLWRQEVIDIHVERDDITLVAPHRKPILLHYSEIRRLICGALLMMPELRKDVAEWLEKPGTKMAVEYMDSNPEKSA
jgi:hypothetical protein